MGHIPQFGRRRTEREQGRVGRTSALHVEESQHGRDRGNTHRMYRDTRPAQEQGACPVAPANIHLRQGAPEICGRHSQPPQDARIHRRQKCKNQDVQLPPRPRHRPPYRIHHPRPAGLSRRGHTGHDRRTDSGRERRENERERTVVFK